MPPRTLASLAHALSAAPDLNAALVALAEGLADVDRSAQLALYRYDARREMLRDQLVPVGATVKHAQIETTFDHFPGPTRAIVSAGSQFVDMADNSADYARLLDLAPIPDGGILSLWGLRNEG